MAEQRQSTMQRIQVGIIGLVVVLLFVSLANMAIDGADQSPADGQPNVAIDPATAPAEAVRDEPLAELGVTPVAPDDSKEKSNAPLAPNNVRAAPAGQHR